MDIPSLDCGELMNCFAHGSKSSNLIKCGAFLQYLAFITAQEISLFIQLISYIIRFWLMFVWFFVCIVVWLVIWLMS